MNNRIKTEQAAGTRPARVFRIPGICAGILCLFTLLGLLTLPGRAAKSEESPETAEWTVMLYMCGTDLESRYGLGTYNLNDIASMWFPEKVMADTGDILTLTDWSADRVNLVLQTGGAKQWHSLEPDEEGRTLGVEIATDRLQRYSFNMIYSTEKHRYLQTLSLVDEQPLASMGAPETMAAFIQWAAQEYPAKKYALVLWDHGGGSRSGVFVDELFDNDILYLYEMDQALADCGVHLELAAIDACLMCSIETAQTLAPYANYMVASEELAAGYGSALSEWLLEIYRNPGCNGGEVGCEFCDATQRKYIDKGTVFEETQLTYSVIDLSYMDTLSEAFDRLFEYAGRLYEQMPTRFNMFSNMLAYSEEYGAGGADMIDLGSFLYSENALMLLDVDCRNALAGVLIDAVYYTVKGSGRSASKGLSFCFAPDLSPEEMDLYARNCHSAPYLALLDAVNKDWIAPDWVYGKTSRLTPVEEFDAYRLEWEITTLNNLPALCFTYKNAGLLECLIRLYRLNEESGMLCLLGESDTLVDWDDAGNTCYVFDPPASWPAIDGGALCSIELVDSADGMSVYNVPIQMSGMRTNLRLRGVRSFDEVSAKWVYDYQILGLWEGYDQENRMPNRAVTTLDRVHGQEFRLLYPSRRLNDEIDDYYDSSAPLTMYRMMKITGASLPAGTYYCGFIVRDIFGHEYKTALTGLTWDGNAFSLVNRQDGENLILY